MKISPSAVRAWLSLAAALVVSASPAAARAAIIYNEAVSGDLAIFSPPLLALQIGTNDLLGNFGIAASSQDNDHFQIQVPLNTQLTAVSFSATRTSGALVNAGWQVFDGDFNQITFFNLNIPATNQIVLASQLPLAPGPYEFFNFGLGSGQRPAFADYSFRFTVTSTTPAVPEPASLLTWLGCSLLALAARTRDCFGNMRLGDKVRIIRGALAGLIGQLVGFKAGGRCYLAVDGFCAGAGVIVDADCVSGVEEGGLVELGGIG